MSRDSIQPEPSKFWVQNVIASLEVVQGNIRRLPSGERLEAKDLNRILELMHQNKQIFLLMMSLHGFNLEGNK
jgi:hypothetical protein